MPVRNVGTPRKHVKRPVGNIGESKKPFSRTVRNVGKARQSRKPFTWPVGKSLVIFTRPVRNVFSAQAKVFVRKAELDAKDSRAAGAKAEVKERARRRCSSAASKVVSLLMQQRGTLLKASKAKQATVVAADASVSHAETNVNTSKAVPPQNSRSGSSDPATPMLLARPASGGFCAEVTCSLSLSTDLLPHHRKDFHFKQKPHVPAELVQKINHLLLQHFDLQLQLVDRHDLQRRQ